MPTKATHADIATRLSKCALFSGLSEGDLMLLARGTYAREFAVGEPLFLQDSPADGFFVIISGKVKISRTTPDGREQILHQFGPGNVVGEVPVFEGREYPAGAIALQPTQALLIQRERFMSLAREKPDLLLAMLASLSQRLRRFTGMIEDLALRDVPARLARHLVLRVGETPSGILRLDGSKASLAERLGTTPESLSRALARLQRRGFIEVSGRTIIVRDANALAHVADM